MDGMHCIIDVTSILVKIKSVALYNCRTVYHYDPEIKQQSLEWQHSGSPPPQKNSECKNPLEKFSLQFFGIKTASSSLSSEGPNYQCGVLLISAGALKDTSKEKCCGKVTKGVLILHDNAPAHWALATQKKLAYLGFQCLDHPPYSPVLALTDYHLFPGLKKRKVAIFRLTGRSLLPWRPGWKDNLLKFF